MADNHKIAPDPSISYTVYNLNHVMEFGAKIKAAEYLKSHHIISLLLKWPLLTKFFFSQGEGLSINHHACSIATIAACVVCRGMLLLSTSFWHGLKLIEFLVKQLLRYTVCCRISENVPRFCCLSEDLENSKDSLIDRRHNRIITRTSSNRYFISNEPKLKDTHTPRAKNHYPTMLPDTQLLFGVSLRHNWAEVARWRRNKAWLIFISNINIIKHPHYVSLDKRVTINLQLETTLNDV
uniref:SFRICE_022834 n=1 Tax=Spodoptera frugiperda TaxID=7108 RepID=A0A2H1VAM3_SPOFR